MSKATHNGTCQACGRSQAYTTGGVAKHGYTTESGYFSGTCSGSDRAPLELDTKYSISVVEAMRDWADQQDMLSEGNIETVPVRVNIAKSWGTRSTTVNMNREEFVANKHKRFGAEEDYRTEMYNRDFDREIEYVRKSMKRNAEFARKDADLLEQLRDKVHGQPLEEREVEATLYREDFTKHPKAAYERQAELKEQGIKATVRRNRYNETTLTYRK